MKQDVCHHQIAIERECYWAYWNNLVFFMGISCILHYKVCYHYQLDVVNGLTLAPLGLLFFNINRKENHCRKNKFLLSHWSKSLPSPAFCLLWCPAQVAEERHEIPYKHELPTVFSHPPVICGWRTSQARAGKASVLWRWSLLAEFFQLKGFPFKRVSLCWNMPLF